MDKNVKIFALVGAFATLSVTLVSIIAILREASWASTGIIIGIICATITVVVPVAQSISMRFKRKGDESTEFDVEIQTVPQEIPAVTTSAESILVRDEEATQEFLDQRILSPSEVIGLSRESKLKLGRMLDEIENFVVADQIHESGGWGLSQENIFEYTSGIKQSPIDVREGGIVSTYMAVRALSFRKIDLNPYHGIGKKAVGYLTKRQIVKGGFGRFSKTRSGEEIKPSYRHTGLAIMALMLLNGPPGAVVKGLEYIMNITIEDIADDAAPSIAIASVLLSCHWALNMVWGKKHLSDNHKNSLMEFLTRTSQELLTIFESDSKDPNNPYAPLWKPYGHSERMVYDSALTTIDLITLCEKVPWDAVCQTLLHIARDTKGQALPYDPSIDKPDIGISLYFAMLCYRPRIKEQLISFPQGELVLSVAKSCLDFSLSSYDKSHYRERTYVDTFANALFLSPTL